MRSYARGGALLMTLVILGAFLVISIAAVGMVNRQFKEIVNQEQEEQAFQIAEAGVNYALWMLDNGLVNFAGPQAVTDYEVTDHTKNPEEVIGSFDLTLTIDEYTPGGSATISATSVGEDAILTDKQQTIEATISSTDLVTYRVVQWDHLP